MIRINFFLLLCILVASLVNSASGETDTAYWNEESIAGKISDRLSAGIEMTYKFDDDAERHYYTSTSFALNCAVLSWLEAGLGYEEIFKKKGDAWQQENRPSIQAAVKWAFSEWKFKNRFRIELRQKQGDEEHYRFRDKLTIKSPWKWTRAEINPYVAEEVFVERTEQEGFNENRTYAGFEMELAEHVGLNLYYLYNLETREREWRSRINVIGTQLEIAF